MKIHLTALLALLCILLAPLSAFANDEVIVPHSGNTTSSDSTDREVVQGQ